MVGTEDKYTLATLKKAVSAVKEDGMSYGAAARLFGIPKQKRANWNLLEELVGLLDAIPLGVSCNFPGITVLTESAWLTLDPAFQAGVRNKKSNYSTQFYSLGSTQNLYIETDKKSLKTKSEFTCSLTGLKWASLVLIWWMMMNLRTWLRIDVNTGFCCCRRLGSL